MRDLERQVRAKEEELFSISSERINLTCDVKNAKLLES
jgi:hypothetical protein